MSFHGFRSLELLELLASGFSPSAVSHNRTVERETLHSWAHAFAPLPKASRR